MEMGKVFLPNVNKRYKMIAMKTKTYFQYNFLKVAMLAEFTRIEINLHISNRSFLFF